MVKLAKMTCIDPSEEYSPQKNRNNKDENLTMSERKASRRGNINITKGRVTFSAEKEPTHSRIGLNQRGYLRAGLYEEGKGLFQHQNKGILKKSNLPLHARVGAKSKIYCIKLN